MADKPNHKAQIDRSGIDWDTDPAGDAEKSSNVTKSDHSFRAPTTGITTVGGGDHGKINKGVKVVKRG